MLTALTPNKAWSERHGRRHRTVTEWARLMLLAIHRRLPDWPVVVVADGEFAALELLHGLRARMAATTRLRKDACLFDLQRGHAVCAPERRALRPLATPGRLVSEASSDLCRRPGSAASAFAVRAYRHVGRNHRHDGTDRAGASGHPRRRLLRAVIAVMTNLAHLRMGKVE